MNESTVGHAGHHESLAPGKTERDSVCGMKVAANPDKAVDHEGKHYYFCSRGCIEKFRANTGQYAGAGKAIAPAKPPGASAATGVIYTCPMHPQIRQAGPGTCPICGMALEPLEATASGMTGDTDQDFAAMMKMHHQGAIDMAQQELQTGKDAKMRAMAMRLPPSLSGRSSP